MYTANFQSGLLTIKNANEFYLNCLFHFVVDIKHIHIIGPATVQN